MRVVLGVSGGIAAYKACALLRLFREAGDDVTVVPTQAALHFVGETTWAALSGRPVQSEVWAQAHEVPHVRLGQEADLVVVAPATADLLARAAHGLADDLLTNVLLTARCPVVVAPAMHTEMWEHPATVANVALLRQRGVEVIEPASGRLTGADTGPGRLPEATELYAACLEVLTRVGASTPRANGPLAGQRVVITAGGTREPLDPVRYLGNRSSGKQGSALAEVAVELGAEVRLISCNMPAPSGPAAAAIECVPVQTALELQDAVRSTAPTADVIVMCAAVADFRPAHYQQAKIKKADDGTESAPTIELVRNPDILAGLVAERAAGGATSPVIVGFAAETGDAHGTVLEHARAKLARKGCDLLVANEVGADKTFGQDTSTAYLLRPGSDAVTVVGPTTKRAVAEAVWQAVGDLLAR